MGRLPRPTRRFGLKTKLPFRVADEFPNNGDVIGELTDVLGKADIATQPRIFDAEAVVRALGG